MFTVVKGGASGRILCLKGSGFSKEISLINCALISRKGGEAPGVLHEILII